MIITVFRNRLKPGIDEEYERLGGRMDEIARAMPGFVSAKDFTAADGERLTVVEFASEEHQNAWRHHVEHVRAQQKGRHDFYTEYSTQVCQVLRESKFPR